MLTLLDISKKDILPALVREIKFYTDAQNSLGTENSYYQRKIKHLCDLLATFDERYHDLKKHMIERQQYPDNMEKAQYLNQVIVPKMEELRAVIDAIEEAVSSDNYPFPTYDDMFISMQ